MEGREIEMNLSKITKAGEQSLTPCPISPWGVREVQVVFPTGQPESQALSSSGFVIVEPARQAGQIQTREWIVALPRQSHRQG